MLGVVGNHHKRIELGKESDTWSHELREKVTRYTPAKSAGELMTISATGSGATPYATSARTAFL